MPVKVCLICRESLIKKNCRIMIVLRFLRILPLFAISYGRMDCSKKEYEKCIRVADPLVKEAHLVFPDNVNDIDQVCTIWNQFVDCLKLYTDECFTDQQRRQFNKAVESPIESVHQMCTKPSYQKEYLQYASCIKNTIIQSIHCGPHYKLLVDQVEQGDIISKSTLCCSHDRFKQCVQRETRRLCDRGLSNGPASRFAVQIIDKALRFLQDQCLNYIPNSGDCQIHPTDSLPFAERSDPLSVSTTSSEVPSWSSVSQDIKNKEIKSSVPTWNSNTPKDVASSEFSTQLLGSRTRPASYGRSNSWSDNNLAIAGNTVQMYPETPSTQSSSRPSWATSIWGSRSSSATTPSTTTISKTDKLFSSQWSTAATTSEMWYPAAGSHAGNEVDEPNQLGLKKTKNSSPYVRFLPKIIVALLTFLFIFY